MHKEKQRYNVMGKVEYILNRHGWERVGPQTFLFHGLGWSVLFYAGGLSPTSSAQHTIVEGRGGDGFSYMTYTLWGLPGAVLAQKRVYFDWDEETFASLVRYNAYPVVSLVQHQCGLRDALLTRGGLAGYTGYTGRNQGTLDTVWRTGASPLKYSDHEKQRILKTERGIYRENLHYMGDATNTKLCDSSRFPVAYRYGAEQWGRWINNDNWFVRTIRLLAHPTQGYRVQDTAGRAVWHEGAGHDGCCYTLQREVRSRAKAGGLVYTKPKGMRTEFMWGLSWTPSGGVTLRVCDGFIGNHSDVDHLAFGAVMTPDNIAYLATKLVACESIDDINVDRWQKEYWDDRDAAKRARDQAAGE
jgi:hypothetical protein